MDIIGLVEPLLQVFYLGKDVTDNFVFRLHYKVLGVQYFNPIQPGVSDHSPNAIWNGHKIYVVGSLV